MSPSKLLMFITFWRHLSPWKSLSFPRKAFRLFWIFLASFILFIVLVDLNFLWLFGKSPKIHQVYNPEMKMASELYSADGKLIGKYFLENRTPVEFSDLSNEIIQTAISTEDIRFYAHHGIDLRATFASIWSIIKGEPRGGSTITQQLVKNLFKTRAHYSRGLLGYIPGVKTLIYKTKEWICSVKIEMNYEKNEILTMYLNTVDFGSNSFGIKSASRTFFSTQPAHLTWEQSALLIGLLKAPTLYSPILNPRNSLDRRNIVIDQLANNGLISRPLADSLVKLPIGLRYNVEDNYDGTATYFRDAVKNALRTWQKETGHDVYTDGLKIYTTLDSRLQAYAEEAVQDHMKFLQRRFTWHWEGSEPWSDSEGREDTAFFGGLLRETRHFKYLKRKFGTNQDSIRHYLNKPHPMTIFTWKGDRDTVLSTIDSLKHVKRYLHAGFISLDPTNGFVKAWVGGIDFGHFKYDHVRQSKRQPGSLFKAFVYSAAMEAGYGPCDSKTDIPVTINYVEKGVDKSWSPHNADWEFSGHSMTLKHAFAKSVNSIAVQLTQELGWKKVIEYAHRMGIESRLADVPSVCLGSSDVSLYEITNAFCTLVNGGFLIEPVLVTRITDHNGRILYEHKPSIKPVLSREAAFYMREMLRAGLSEPGGTTQALFEHDLFRYDTDFGGKTGTSSNYSDGWFVGVTPKLVSGAWAGSDHRQIHFRTSEMGEGCKTALPIFGRYMEKVLQDEKLRQYRGKFPKPEFRVPKSYTCHTRYVKQNVDSIPLNIPDSLTHFE